MGALEPHMVFGKRRRGGEFYHASRFFAGTKGDRMCWLYGQPEYQEDSIKWIKRWAKEGISGRYFKAAAKRYQLCQKFLFSVLNRPVPRESNLLLKYCDKKNYLLLLHTCTLGVSIDAFDDYFSQVFAGALTKTGFARVTQNSKDWSFLQQAAYQSVVMRYKLETIKSAKKAKKIDIKNYAKEIERMWKKYFWLTMGWSGTKPLSKNDIEREIKRQMKLSPAARQKEKIVIERYVKEIKRKRARVIGKYKIPVKVIGPYLKLLDEFARLHDERKEIQMRTLREMDKIRIAVAGLYDLKLKDIEWLKILELRRLIRIGKMPYKAIRQRRIGYCVKYARGKLVFEKQGRVAVAVIDKEMSAPSLKHKEIKGVIASAGIARGRAIVTDDAKVAAKIIKQGDIIIASMTTPDFVPAMKKAGAIVTNEGGVTVHAAIVSRELGIPCLTGTLIATRVFKTGDMIEVDAVKGVVRKI